MGCHGLNAVSGLIIPDLRGSAWIHDPKGWNAVVREGLLAKNGMASFADYLDSEQAEAIRAYIIEQAWRGLKVQQQAAGE